MLDPQTVAEFIRETARTEILPRFQALRSEDIREKEPGQIVTIADIRAEQRLTELLAQAAPGTMVLGEEAVAEDPGCLSLLAGEAPVWVIDPIDGTTNFANARPGFGVIVAYVERAVTRAGWLYDPLAGVMITAVAGEGAWSAGRRLRVAAEVPPQAMVGSAYGRTHAGERAGPLLEESGRIGALRNHRCSALEYMEIALGEAHFSLHSRSLPWDHAAGLLIVAEAGGVSSFLDGSRYDPRIPDRPVLAAASPAGWETIWRVVAPQM